MATTVSGKIKRKTVKAGTYGDKVSFLIGANWVSCFATDKKLSEEVKQTLRELQEGDEAEFLVVENPGTNLKGETVVYLNIVGVERVTRIDSPAEEEYKVGSPPPNVPPVGRPEPQKESGDTRVRSMAASYGKDYIVETNKIRATLTLPDLFSYEDIITVAQRLEKYILTGE